MPTTATVSIIVSSWNEEQSIENVIRSVAAAMPEAEIVIVHGGNDRTLEIARSLQNEFPQVLPVRNENDRGKGHGIKTGIARASGHYMAQFDADLQFFASDLPALVQPLVAGQADVCLGSRFLPSSDRAAYKPSFFRDLGNRVLAAYISVLIGQKVTDVTAGMKSWTRGAIERIDFRDDRYSYEAEIVVRGGLLRQRIREVPVCYASRSDGESMHKSNLAVIRAGMVIIVKCFACWVRTLFTRKK
jgi:glycosyltransferase involved in cell wall biosynthesis